MTCAEQLDSILQSVANASLRVSLPLADRDLHYTTTLFRANEKTKTPSASEGSWRKISVVADPSSGLLQAKLDNSSAGKLPTVAQKNKILRCIPPLSGATER